MNTFPTQDGHERISLLTFFCAIVIGLPVAIYTDHIHVRTYGRTGDHGIHVSTKPITKGRPVI